MKILYLFICKRSTLWIAEGDICWSQPMTIYDINLLWAWWFKHTISCGQKFAYHRMTSELHFWWKRKSKFMTLKQCGNSYWGNWQKLTKYNAKWSMTYPMVCILMHLGFTQKQQFLAIHKQFLQKYFFFSFHTLS